MPIGLPRIFMKSSNIPPVAIGDTLSTYMGVPVDVYPLLNDDDPDNFPGTGLLIYSYESTSFDGSKITIYPNKTTLKYTPKINYFGVDIFQYTATDGLGVSNTAVVKLSVICKPPIKVSRNLNLTSGKTYNLDITDPNSAPSEIVFVGGLGDRDVNIPAQPIRIIPGSIVKSSNITINLTSNTVINFTVAVPTGGASTTVGTFIDYELENTTCGLKSTDKSSTGGSSNNSNIRIVQGYLGVTINEGNVPLAFTKYPMFDLATKDYPWDNEGWFIFTFNTYSVPDQYYITMVSKPYKNPSGNWTTDKSFHGLIGPIGDSINEGNGRFLFWKDKGMNLDCWGCTPNGGSAYQMGCVQVYKPSIPDEKDPARYFSDKNIPPTNAEIATCLGNVGKPPFNNTVTDYTGTFTGTGLPPFVAAL